ncbi:protein transport protein Sec61 subunit gamma-like [Chionomys nivalis]|uniref:protein transport protein Sec61 subunit gamma-like n=1 Tax=Chionomys nivalis TaxID=269649 RepID=UPI0025985ADB|nr:protein transport protein Sec61 subunit gamma-like [Chionomys nivalis]
MDQVMQFVEPSRQFVKDSIRLVKRCTKPDRKEFQKTAMATGIGFAIMGFIGFFVKLIHIPIIVGAECFLFAGTRSKCGCEKLMK